MVVPAGAETEEQFCKALTSQVLPWQDTLYYRDDSGNIVAVKRDDILPRSGLVFFYFVRTNLQDANRASALNIKFVLKAKKPISRRQFVDLRNNRWQAYGQKRQARIINDCARLTVDGYDRFHLNNSRNYCLSIHFHQRAPEFETLATVERSESFAFQDMVGGPPSDLLSGLFGVTPAKADTELSTARLAYSRSWIRNFNHVGDPGRCIAINPEFPESIDSAHLRITNLGTEVGQGITPHNWYLKFRQ
jgi:hypothetical protein